MNKSYIPKILEILQRQAETTVTLFDIFFSSYNESYREARKSLNGQGEIFNKDWAQAYIERQKFYSLLNKLKNEGLIQKNKTRNKKTIWAITKKGLEKLYLKSKDKSVDNDLSYQKEPDNTWKVIIFDVPERERRKRHWLRTALFSLGFSLLQQSVWIGKNKIPEKFLSDLNKRDMISYVHIFEINRAGSIARVR